MSTRAMSVGSWTSGSTLVLLFAAMAVAAGPSPAPLAGAATTELTTLQTAYATLAQADHDYKGHRIKAMHEIQAACKLLGPDPKGDSKGKEAQGTSDAQLRAAQQLLQNAHNMAAAANQPSVVLHIDNAIKQLNIALTIK